MSVSDRRRARLEKLAPHLELVRLRAEAALTRRLNAGYGFADSRIPAETFVRDEKTRERLGRDSLRPRDTHKEQAAELERALADAAAREAAQTSPLTDLADRLRLEPAERALLSAACAYELDPDARALVRTLAGARRPGLYCDVLLDLAPELLGPSELLAALHPDGALRHTGLLALEGEGRVAAAGLLGESVAASRRLLDWLLGDPRIAAPLSAALRLLSPAAAPEISLAQPVLAQVERIGDLLSKSPEPAMVLVQGPEGSGKLGVALRLAAALNRSLAHAPLPLLLELERRRKERGLVGRALGEALLSGAVAYLPGIEAAAAQEREFDPESAAALERHPDLVVLATREGGVPSLPITRPYHLVRIPPPSLEVREEAWRRGLLALGDAAEVGQEEVGGLAGRYVIGPGAIAEVVSDARAFARAAAAPVRVQEIERAVDRRLTLRLGPLATRISRRARFEEMVVADDLLDTLKDMVAMVRERSRILERWGYGRHLSLSRGVSALFSGPPGTGKTMAAAVISSELGLELFRIDLASVVSKWVGETEKHLGRIFDEAQDAQAMLLFDEADSLFGKRAEVKSATDRYANLEVNYLLQRMEEFDGISILTTNQESGIDPAFMRRLNFRVRFQEPDADEREHLWRALVPPETGLSDAVDFSELARRFEMSGGHIRNAIVRAAVIAAREGRPMCPEDLVAGAHHEYFELGKVMPTSGLL